MVDDYSWPPTSLNTHEAVSNMKQDGQIHVHGAFIEHASYGRPLTGNFVKQTPCQCSFAAPQMTVVINKRVLGFRCMSPQFMLLWTGLHFEMGISHITLSIQAQKMVETEGIPRATGILPHLKCQAPPAPIELGDGGSWSPGARIL